jgi:hypothetical protein
MTNSWFTSRRLANAGVPRLNCIFWCEDCEDDYSHYLQCDLLCCVCLQDVQHNQSKVDSKVESHAARIDAIEASLGLLLEPPGSKAAPSSPKKKKAKHEKGSCATV